MFCIHLLVKCLVISVATVLCVQSDRTLHPDISQNYSRVARHHYDRDSIVFDSCGGIFRDSTTVLNSPFYPANYSANMNCRYLFRSPYHCETEFHIQFLEFSLESSKGCAKDRLQIGSDVLCGKVIGIRKYKTMDGVLTIVFRTDDSMESSGFHLVVTRLACDTKSDREEEVYPIYERPERATTEGVELIEPITDEVPDVTPPSRDSKSMERTWNNQYLPPGFGSYLPPAIPSGCSSPWYPSQYYPSRPHVPSYPYPPLSNNNPNIPPNGYNPNYPGTNNPGVGGYPNNNPALTPSYPYPPAGQPENHFPQPQYPQYPQPTPVPNIPLNPGNPNPNNCIPYPSCTNNQPEFPREPPIQRVEQQAQVYPNVLSRCCSRSINLRRFYLSSPEFPSRNQRNTDCLFLIEKAHPQICRLRIEFRFFFVGSFSQQLGCTDSFIEIDGQRICGCNTGLRYTSQWGLGAKAIRMYNRPVFAQNVRGFVMEVVQEECPYRISQRGVDRSGESETPDELEDRSDVVPRWLHSEVTHTNSTSTTTYYYYNGEDEAKSPNAVLNDGSKPDVETKEQFDHRSEAPTSSQFFFLSSILNNPDRCAFSYGNLLQLYAEPQWQLRPKC